MVASGTTYHRYRKHKNWSLEDHDCRSHFLPENEGMSVELDKDVLNDPNAVVIG